MTLEATLTVRSYELDSFGHVNHATLLSYLEAARGEYLRQVGLDFGCFARWSVGLVVARAELAYRTPALADDVLTVRSTMHTDGNCAFRAEQHILKPDPARPDGPLRTVLDGTIRLVFISPTGRPTAVPAEFRRAFGLELP